MSCYAILARIIEKGSDDLAHGLYRRLCADRTAASRDEQGPANRPPAQAWTALVSRAMREQVISVEEARRLLAFLTCTLPSARGAGARTSAGAVGRDPVWVDAVLHAEPDRLSRAAG